MLKAQNMLDEAEQVSKDVQKRPLRVSYSINQDTLNTLANIFGILAERGA